MLALTFSPPWDRALLASGGYLYAPFVPRDLDVRAMLRAGTLLFYAEGAAATMAVKRLTGTTTLTVDGKTDASNRGDMLTQKLAAHLPLLLHDAPRQVAVIGLGSGVTVGAALTHPIRGSTSSSCPPKWCRRRRTSPPRTATPSTTRGRASSSATAARTCCSPAAPTT